MNSAFIFPGQGAQYAGMGKSLAEQFPVARQAFEEADEALGFRLSGLCFEGPEESLRLTENTQPALLTVSTAAHRVLAENGHKPDYVAGHSLGEYSALVAAGSLAVRDAVRLVRERENIGPVNLRAESEAAEIESQLSGMQSERADLMSAIARLRQGISSLNRLFPTPKSQS